MSTSSASKDEWRNHPSTALSDQDGRYKLVPCSTPGCTHQVAWQEGDPMPNRCYRCEHPISLTGTRFYCVGGSLITEDKLREDGNWHQSGRTWDNYER